VRGQRAIQRPAGVPSPCGARVFDVSHHSMLGTPASLLFFDYPSMAIKLGMAVGTNLSSPHCLLYALRFSELRHHEAALLTSNRFPKNSEQQQDYSSKKTC
jgi:hypothetical protein